MTILVHFKGNRFKYVEDSDLDSLIANKTIIAFKHESGWVKIDEDSSNQSTPKIDEP